MCRIALRCGARQILRCKSWPRILGAWHGHFMHVNRFQCTWQTHGIVQARAVGWWQSHEVRLAPFYPCIRMADARHGMLHGGLIAPFDAGTGFPCSPLGKCSLHLRGPPSPCFVWSYVGSNPPSPFVVFWGTCVQVCLPWFRSLLGAKPMALPRQANLRVCLPWFLSVLEC